MTPQLKLFNEDDAEQPIPLEVASLHNFPLQHHMQDDDTLVYAVQDWLTGVAQTVAPAQFWRELKKRMKKAGVELSIPCLQLPYRASNGKTYKMDFADEEALYQITQRMEANTGIRNEVLTFLAKSGVFASLMRQDQEAAEIQIGTMRRVKALKADRQPTAKKTIQKAEKDPVWQVAREMGVVTRKQLTALLMALNSNVNIGRATNHVYEGTFGTNAEGLRKILHLGKKQNPRDFMSDIGLGYTMIAEASCRIQLADYADDDIVPLETIYATLKSVSEGVGLQASQWAKTLGVDLITGRKALKS